MSNHLPNRIDIIVLLVIVILSWVIVLSIYIGIKTLLLNIIGG